MQSQECVKKSRQSQRLTETLYFDITIQMMVADMDGGKF